MLKIYQDNLTNLRSSISGGERLVTVARSPVTPEGVILMNGGPVGLQGSGDT